MDFAQVKVTLSWSSGEAGVIIMTGALGFTVHIEDNKKSVHIIHRVELVLNTSLMVWRRSFWVKCSFFYDCLSEGCNKD